MPQNKDALLRYRIINRCLTNGKYANVEELREACENALGYRVSVRTIKGDIENMRYESRLGYEAPIKYDHFRKAYCYSDPKYSIDHLPLDETEIQSLMFASSLLEQFQNIGVFKYFSDAIEKIRNAVKIKKLLRQDDKIDFIDFDVATTNRGLEYFPVIVDAILKKKVLKLEYKAFEKSRSYTHHLHPYLLKEYLYRWYVFGYNEYWKGLRIYALDRIVTLEPVYTKEYREPQKDPRDYFKNIIGVTRFEEGPPPTIVLKFSHHQANYILTQPLHPSQKVLEETKEHVSISLEVHPSPELEIKILGWGEDVEVLEPEELRNLIFDKTKIISNKKFK
ncbi:MAG: WYL domain-containing protein [Gillisia sp.]